jgi:hypothetical protein
MSHHPPATGARPCPGSDFKIARLTNAPPVLTFGAWAAWTLWEMRQSANKFVREFGQQSGNVRNDKLRKLMDKEFEVQEHYSPDGLILDGTSPSVA